MSLLDEVSHQISLCSRCGYCRAACQTLEVKRSESWSTRGRITLIDDFIGGDLKGGGDLSDRIYSCLLCGRCEVYCPPRVKVRETIEGARDILVERGFAPRGAKSIAENVKNIGNPLGSPKDRVYGGVNHASRGKTLLFRGCVASLRSVENLRAAEELLRSADYPFFEFSEEFCCGYPLEILGFREDASDIYRKNYDVMSRAGVERVVTTCPSCYQAFRERYPRHIENFDLEASHIIDVYDELMDEGRLTPLVKMDLRVSYQDPCALGRRSRYPDLARLLIERIPGLRRVEPKDVGLMSRCCGGGSNLSLLFPEIHEGVREGRIGEFMDGGCHIVITSCPTCLFTLREAARGKAIAVDGLSTLLAASTGLRVNNIETRSF
ncbi:MAG: (Fe-S)-binding protein [Candidatus Geothermarchaeales archaeon]